jgi:FkbM family methyltransferase
VPPIHDIEKLLTIRKRSDPDGTLHFAELEVDGCLLRYCISSPASEWRVRTLFTRQPGTIDWIDSFDPGEVFVDVGANVGSYSLYAAAVSGARVFAFEPESQDYAELCRSIYFNEELRDDMLAWCAAIGEHPVDVAPLLVRQSYAGVSYDDLGDLREVPGRDGSAEERFAQGSVRFSLDHLVDSGILPVPDHVRIDVGAEENEVVRGMRGLLERRAIRTVLLEADPASGRAREFVDSLLGQGWVVNADQLRLSRDGVRPAEAVLAELRAGSFRGSLLFGRSAGDVAFATRALRRFSPSELEQIALPS